MHRCRRGVLGGLVLVLLLPACAEEVPAPPSLDEQLAQATPVAAEDEPDPDRVDPADDTTGEAAATADDAVARDDLLDRLDSMCFDRAPEMARLDQELERRATADGQGLRLGRIAPLLRRNHDIQRELATAFEEAAARDPHFEEVSTILQDGLATLDRLAATAEANDQEGFLDTMAAAFDMSERLVAAARDAGLQVCYVEMQTVVADR